jgi:putative peptide zinc metalloprotease protein
LAVRLQRRPELEAVKRFRRGVARWLLRDPLALKHWEFSEAEYGLLELLDGRRSFAAIRDEFETRFAPLRLSREDFDRFLVVQHGQGVLTADGSGQASTFRERVAKRRRTERWRQWLNPLAIRLPPLIDPQPWLDATRFVWGPLFAGPAVVAGAVAVGLTLAFGVARAGEISARLPDAGALLAGENFVLLGVALALAKVLHELAHACVCRKVGAECHELGILFLVGVPCLYCDVSDVWRVPRRRARVAVSLAGMWAEALVAAAAFWVWWWSVPGVVHAVALNLVVVCSVGTLLFNLNPLLKYDGYHALADLIEAPNLAERANRALTAWLWDPLWGNPRSHDAWGDGLSPRGLVAFGVASAAYRFALTYVILLLVYRALRDRDLAGPATIFAGFLVLGTAAPMVLAVAKQARAHRKAGRGGRAWFAVAVLGAAVAGLLALPWPYSVRGEALFEPAEAERVYVTAPGLLVEGVAEGSRVAAGDRIARLVNRDLDAEVSRVAAEVAEQRVLVETLRKRRGDDPNSARELPAAEAALAELTRQRDQTTRDRDRLDLRSPKAGLVWAGEFRPRVPSAEGELPGWSGSPLSQVSREPWLETGTTVCLVATGDHWDAVAELSQGDVELIREGLQAEVLLDRAPLRLLRGTVVSIARHTAAADPRAAADPGSEAGGETAEGGTGRPGAAPPAPYEIRVRLDSTLDTSPALGSTGKVRIRVGTWSVGRRVWRELSKTFKFET